MSREDIQKLLGGYATGTLTAEERDALFAAALEDQELFEALAREEPLRELLQGPVAKSRLTAALRTTRVPWLQRWLRPALLATGVAAVALVAVLALRNPRQPQVVTIAQVAPPSPPAPQPSAPPVAAPPAPPAAEPAPESRQIFLKKVVPPAPAPDEKTKTAAAPATRESVGDRATAADALTAAAPPPPAPSAPRLAAPRAPVISLQEPLVTTFAARNSVPAIQDARALFYGAPLQLPLQTNFVRAEADAKSRVVAQAGAPAPASPALHLGLRYTLHRIPPAASEDLNPSQELASVDNLQLSLQANDGGYLYVFERDAAGQWTLRASEPVARMAPYLLPHTGSLAFPPAGNLELFVLFSRQPINPEDRQLTPHENQAITGAAVDRAVYVVSTRADLASQQLAFPLTLRRR